MSNQLSFKFLKDAQMAIRNFFYLEMQLSQLSDSLYNNRQRLQLFFLMRAKNQENGCLLVSDNPDQLQNASDDDNYTLEYRNNKNELKEDLKSQKNNVEGEKKQRDEKNQDKVKQKQRQCPFCGKMITHKYMKIHIENLHKNQAQKQ